MAARGGSKRGPESTCPAVHVARVSRHGVLRPGRRLPRGIARCVPTRPHAFPPLCLTSARSFSKSRPSPHQPHRRCEQAGARAEPGEEEGIQGPVDGGRGTFRTRARAPPRARPRARRVDTVERVRCWWGQGICVCVVCVWGGNVALSRGACGHSMPMHRPGRARRVGG